MGSLLLLVIPDFAESWSKGNIEHLPIKSPIYFRYVDDILLAAPPEYLPKILETFNSFHNRLQFTLETNKNNYINFLDVL